ncbi:MAG: hypothetical protein R2690_07510 [Acidimicrobiales bacterium]
MYVTPDPDASAPLATPSVAGEPGPRRWYQRVPAWAGPVAVGAIAASACAYTAIVDPNTNAGIFPACYFKEITGLDCPAAGSPAPRTPCCSVIRCGRSTTTCCR